MRIPFQMRAPSKRSALIASAAVLVAAFAWGLSRSSQKAETRPPGRVALTKTSSASDSESRPADSDHDGFPDFAELRTFEDRENFRRWFTSIAETQFYQLSEQWKKDQRDCAGLVRFSVREALRRHDRAWFQRMGPAYSAVAHDVAGFDLDHNRLGEKIFRAEPGSFQESDLRDGAFNEFADARTLKNFNVEFVSRDRRQAQPGDLLFYYQPWVQKFPFHVMVFLGTPQAAPNGRRDWVVYHTGATATDEGAVKKVELSVLDHHPDPRWRPVENNKNFLGFYRLKILQ
jgi:uncharacterized protein YfaT (DUF1175 family)